MTDDIYHKLAHHLDELPAGFPSTESGVEIRILKRLFAPEDAELALHTTLIPEEARVIARRAGITKEEAEERLHEMAQKGLILKTPRGRRITPEGIKHIGLNQHLPSGDDPASGMHGGLFTG